MGQLAAEPGAVIEWSKQTQHARLGAQASPLPMPPGLTGEAAALWEVDFWQSAAGRERLRQGRSYPVEVAADGSFRAAGVLPGTYTLWMNVAGSMFSRQIVVPETSEATPFQFDAGTLPVTKPVAQSSK